MPRTAAAEPQDPTPIEIPGAEAPSAPTVSPSVTTAATISRESMLVTMRNKFAKEKRVRVRVHNDAPVQVQVNGYSFLIRENVPVEVPESVADLLEQAGYL